MITLTYGFGVALAAFAGVMAAPIYNVSPQMGSELIIVVFAVVVIGGMGSILGRDRHRLRARRDRGTDQSVLPRGVEHGDLRHHGDRAAGAAGRPVRTERVMERVARSARQETVSVARARPRPSALPSWSPRLWLRRSVTYPLFLMQAMCFALFACAFNLLIGYVGLLSFGHALYFGWASYLSAYSAKVWGFPPELGDPDRHRDGRRLRSRRRFARDPPAGHLFRHDHAGAGADDVFLRAAGEIHRRRGRHPGGAARSSVRPYRSQERDGDVRCWCW